MSAQSNAAPSSATGTSSDAGAQSNATSSDQTAGANLPQTASPLPLLGLLGIGSIGAGLLSRRKK
ncbi:MAG: LPXTG cell wall anchor domain-containing protein [Terriglobales bacterium]